MMPIKKTAAFLGLSFLLSLSTTEVFAAFSPEDVQWLQDHNNTITVAPEENYPPFIFNDESGEPGGMSVDLLRSLADEANIKIVFLPSGNLASILEKAKQGGEFVITSLTKTEERDQFLNFTDAYVDVPVVILVRTNSQYENIAELSQKKVAVGEGYGVQSFLVANEDFVLVPYSDDEVSLAKLIFGEVDAAVMDLATASYLVTKDGLSGVKILGTVDFTYHLSFAVPENATELLGVLNQLMKDADPAVLTTVINKWMELNDPNINKYLALVVLLASLTVLLVVLWIYTIRRYVKGHTAQLLLEKQKLEKDMRGETEETKEHLKELEATKSAMLNLLEDVNETKLHLEFEKKKRDIVSKNANIGIWEWDPVTMTGLWDYWMYEVFGEKEDTSLAPMAIREKRMDPDSFEKLKELKEKIVKGELEMAWLEYEIHLDQGLRYMRSGAFALKDENGKVTKVIGVDVDMTREKELEKMKDEFLAVASHELRTPMTAIKGLSSMILSGDYGKITAKLQRQVQDIFNVTGQLIKLVNNMLDATSLESGRMIFRFSRFNPTDAIASLTNLLEIIAQQKKIKLIVGKVPQVAIFCDQDKFKEILNNLIGNSLKFTQKGKITLEGVEDSNKVTFYVTDTGDGISEEDQKKLFQKFRRINSEGRGKPAGSGLGLYIAKQMAQHMGGDLWIEKSVTGQGSTFAFAVLKADSPLASKMLKENQESL